MDNDEIVDLLLHHGDGAQKIMHRTGCSYNDVIELALDNNIERCQKCGNWTPCYELARPEAVHYWGLCDQCVPKGDE